MDRFHKHRTRHGYTEQQFCLVSPSCYLKYHDEETMTMGNSNIAAQPRGKHILSVLLPSSLWKSLEIINYSENHYKWLHQCMYVYVQYRDVPNRHGWHLSQKKTTEQIYDRLVFVSQVF